MLTRDNGLLSTTTQLARTLFPTSLTAARSVLGCLLLMDAVGLSYWLSVGVVAAITDFADGFLARRWNVSTATGAALDLLADGLFFLGFVVAFWRGGVWPSWVVVAVLSSALPQLAAQALFALRRRRVGSPRRAWNRIVGGYSYFCVITVSIGVLPLPVGVVQALVAWVANLLDLRLAVLVPADRQ